MQTALILLALAAQDDKAVEEALDRFKAAYKSNSEPDRATAVAELAKTPHEKTALRITPLLTTEAATVRIAAARGLGGFVPQKKKVVPSLLQALPANEKLPDVQIAIFESLGKLDDEGALGAIHRSFEDKDSRVAKAAIAAAAAMRNASSIHPIVELAKKLDKLVKIKDDGRVDAGAAGGFNVPGGEDPNKKRAQELLPAAIKALQDITKQNWLTVGEWVSWWNANRATFKTEK